MFCREAIDVASSQELMCIENQIIKRVHHLEYERMVARFETLRGFGLILVSLSTDKIAEALIRLIQWYQTA